MALKGPVVEKRKKNTLAAAAAAVVGGGGVGDGAAAVTSAIIFVFTGGMANSSFCYSPSYSHWTCAWTGLVALLAYECREAVSCTI